MIYEVKKGRVCESLQEKQQIEINSLESQLVTQGKRIALLNEGIENRDLIINSFQNQLELSNTKHEIDKKILKARNRGLKRIIFIESGAIGILLAVILL